MHKYASTAAVIVSLFLAATFWAEWAYIAKYPHAISLATWFFRFRLKNPKKFEALSLLVAVLPFFANGLDLHCLMTQETPNAFATFRSAILSAALGASSFQKPISWALFVAASATLTARSALSECLFGIMQFWVLSALSMCSLWIVHKAKGPWAFCGLLGIKALTFIRWQFLHNSSRPLKAHFTQGRKAEILDSVVETARNSLSEDHGPCQIWFAETLCHLLVMYIAEALLCLENPNLAAAAAALNLLTFCTRFYRGHLTRNKDFGNHFKQLFAYANLLKCKVSGILSFQENRCTHSRNIGLGKIEYHDYCPQTNEESCPFDYMSSEDYKGEYFVCTSIYLLADCFAMILSPLCAALASWALSGNSWAPLWGALGGAGCAAMLAVDPRFREFLKMCTKSHHLIQKTAFIRLAIGLCPQFLTFGNYFISMAHKDFVNWLKKSRGIF